MVLTKAGSILGPIATVLGYVMDILFRFTSSFGVFNVGLCIILFTIVMKTLMIPLTIKQQKTTKLMSVMNPEIQTAKALIRRSQIYSQGASGDAGIRKGPFAVDTLKMECLKNGEPLNFTAREMTLFRFLMEHPGQVFTKEQLYTQVWNEAVVDDNTITVYVKRIRNKIEDDPKQPRYLKTVRGIGYMLNV